jgi:hypothetical protein
MQILAMGDFEYFGRIGGFGDPNFRRPARPHIARGQVDDAGSVSGFGHPKQRAAAGLFHIVGMSGYGEEIEHLFNKGAGDKIASGTFGLHVTSRCRGADNSGYARP